MVQVYRRRIRAVAALAGKVLTQGLALFGLAALLGLVSGSHKGGDDALTDARAAVASVEEAALYEADPALNSEQRTLASYLARRYRVAADALETLVRESYAVGRQWKLDPLLILSVIAVESSFNPIAESGYGAKGLMQVVPRFHLDKLSAHGGQEAVLDPRVNIRVGAEILQHYISQTGSLESALQMYGGAIDDPESRYARKVLAEKERLRRVLQSSVERARI